MGSELPATVLPHLIHMTWEVLDIVLLYLLCLGGGEPGKPIENPILFSLASTGKVVRVGLWPSQCSTWLISEDGRDGVSTAKLSL